MPTTTTSLRDQLETALVHEILRSSTIDVASGAVIVGGRTLQPGATMAVAMTGVAVTFDFDQIKRVIEQSRRYDGITAAQCLDRYVALQREDPRVGAALTASQLTAARAQWSAQLRARSLVADHHLPFGSETEPSNPLLEK